MAVVAAVGLASGLVQTLLTALQTQEVKEMCSMFSCGSQLEKLKDTMKNINALLLDVDSKRQGITNEGQVWVEKLKDAVYDIDDLLDEFATIGQQRKQMEDAGFRKMVGNFFSRNNKFFVNFNLSGEIKKLREKLDHIAKDHKNYGLSIDVSKHVVRRRETSSTISDLEVIGRDGDQETILHELFSDSSPSDFSGHFVCIVGIGGLGKTTLAQLVYNHKKVEEAFSLRIWVCVSENFNPKEILDKILKAQSKTESSNLEAAQREVKTLLLGKKYLLVLDDVWNESHEKWRDLMPYLVSDVSGSKIIVTGRSEKVATSIGGKIFLHKLQGLSQENSWRLFKRIAFETESEDRVDHNRVAIGKEIMKKCVNVPLCIRVIASLLYELPPKKWESYRSIDLSANMSDAEGKEYSIMPTLRFSYYQLTPELKSCFSFCSLFPKDHVMEKELLIQLWMAEGYLVPDGKAQSLEDVGDQYFTILLNRCFFQDIKLDKHDNVISFKMHDLMHDLALNVAGKESLINTPADNDRLRDKIRHISTTIRDRSNLCLTDTLRTYINVPERFFSEEVQELEASSLDKVSHIISKCNRLRVLSLSTFVISCNLPKRLGELLHLRFLDLSKNGFELLPKSITKLHNLQILKLRECTKLKELPEDMSKLANLKVLDIYRCNGLTYMPRGMNNLKHLHTLTQFVVGCIDLKQIQGSKLGDLQALRSLKGDLCIRLLDFSSCNMPHVARLVNSVVSKLVGVAVSIDINLTCDMEMKSMCIVKEGFERLRWGLKWLSIDSCMELDIEDEEEEWTPWRCLQSLCYLELIQLPKMVKLPKGFQYLTSLRSLCIIDCNNLEELGECIGFLTSLQLLSISGSSGILSLPESMRQLTSLTTLEMYGICNELRKRCREPHGEDWPKICHILTLLFLEEDTTHNISHKYLSLGADAQMISI